MGIFMAITPEIFIGSLLMLRDAPLNLVLNTDNEQLSLTDVKTYVHQTKFGKQNWKT